MIPNLNAMITILVFGTPVLILIFFLPAIVELKKPKDCGPRMITDRIPYVMSSKGIGYRLANVEEEQKFAESLFRLLANITEFLPNLEA